MAEVKMDLAELDLLRKSKEKAEQETQKVQEQLNKVNEDLAAVKASKEVIRKVITKYPKEIASPMLETYKMTPRDAAGVTSRVIMAIKHHIHGHVGPHELEYTISRELEYTRLVPENSCRPFHLPQEDTEVTEYINMDSVKQELREQAEQKVGDELSRLRQQVVTLKADSATWKENSDKEWQKKMDGLVEYTDNKVNNIIKQDNEQYASLLKDYNDLKEDKDMRTTEQKLTTEIDTLKQQLQKIADRPWWKRVLNID